jgi:hypothetical protein
VSRSLRPRYREFKPHNQTPSERQLTFTLQADQLLQPDARLHGAIRLGTSRSQRRPIQSTSWRLRRLLHSHVTSSLDIHIDITHRRDAQLRTFSSHTPHFSSHPQHRFRQISPRHPIQTLCREFIITATKSIDDHTLSLISSMAYEKRTAHCMIYQVPDTALHDGQHCTALHGIQTDNPWDEH